MSAMCAAKGCHFMPSPGSLFCYRHPTPIQRKRVAVAQFDGFAEDWPWPVEAPPAPSKVKSLAVVTWNARPGWYVARHVEYWAGVGASPGAALRDMRPLDDLPF